MLDVDVDLYSLEGPGVANLDADLARLVILDADILPRLVEYRVLRCWRNSELDRLPRVKPPEALLLAVLVRVVLFADIVDARAAALEYVLHFIPT